MVTDGKRWGWQNSLRALRREIKNTLGAPEGIEALVDELNADQRADFLRALYEIRSRIAEIIPALEATTQGQSIRLVALNTIR